MKVSECCGAVFYEPGYPDNDICSACNEHADPVEQDQPSVTIIEMPPLPDGTRMGILKKVNMINSLEEGEK